MKKFILILSTSLVLTACGPSESEKMSVEKQQLAEEVKKIKKDIDNEKTRKVSMNNTLDSINNELKQMKGNSITNDMYSENFKTYATTLGQVFSDLHEIDSEIDMLDNDPIVKKKLKTIRTTIEDTIKSYEAPFKTANPPQTFNEIHKQIEQANKDLKKAISNIESGYNKKNKTAVDEGKTRLQKVIDQFNEIQFQ